MTFRALAFLFAHGKLPFVRVGDVAVAARGVRNPFFEVAPEVARRTRHRCMFALERIFGLGVIEVEASEHGLPAARGMAGVAALLELTPVGVTVAILAGGEFQTLVASRAAGHIRLVALFTGDLGVQPSQRVARSGVIELFHRFPILNVMALRTLGAELPLVRIGMAGRAGTRLPKKRLRGILILDQCS